MLTFKRLLSVYVLIDMFKKRSTFFWSMNMYVLIRIFISEIWWFPKILHNTTYTLSSRFGTREQYCNEWIPAYTAQG